MKITILTLPLHNNYGGLLQAYALQTILENEGHQVLIYNWSRIETFTLKVLLLSPLKRYLINLRHFKKLKDPFESFKKIYSYRRISQHTQQFIKNRLHTVTVKTYADYLQLPRYDADAIVVGSDQIWRPIYFPYIEVAFLKFAEDWDIKKVAYAASFGVDTWEYSTEQTVACRELIKRFNGIGVREKSAIELCKEFLGVDAQWVLDPTLLLTPSHYRSLYATVDFAITFKNKILCYILDESSEKNGLIDELLKEFRLSVYRFQCKIDDECVPIKKRIQPPVEVWLKGFDEADLVVTDSFHACVFSIIFNTDFYVLENKDRGQSRISSLLEMFGLQNRLISDISHVQKDKKINWEQINEKKSLLSEASLSFLRNSLH